MRSTNKTKRRLLLWWLGCLFPAVFVHTLLQANDARAADRIILVGDVHGDAERLKGLLRRAKLLNDDDRWVGGDAILVQTGDFMDRGPQVRETMDLLMRVQSEAQASGGQAIVLLGNHEMMNLMGDFRYVHSDVYCSFADGQSAVRRRKAFERYVKTIQRQARENGQEPPGAADLESAWMEARPLGFIEYVEAIGPDGKYGKWLRKLPAVAKIDGILAVHGGIHPSISRLGLDGINRRIERERRLLDSARRFIDPFFSLEETLEAARQRMKKAEASGNGANGIGSWPDPREEEFYKVLKSFVDLGQWLSVHPDGPLWFRGYATWGEEEGMQHVSRLLDEFEVSRIVVGHTILSKDRILSRFDGKVYLVDTLTPSALVIENGEISAVYLSTDGEGGASDEMIAG
jgi:hypothetical protein